MRDVRRTRARVGTTVAAMLAGFTTLAGACAPPDQPAASAGASSRTQSVPTTATAVRATATPPSIEPSVLSTRTRSAQTPPTATAPADRFTIQMGDYFFSPSVASVPTGTTVVWQNVGTEGHDATAEDGSFHSRVLIPGASWAMTFHRPGLYRYFCSPHVGDGMFGELVVE